MVPAKAEKVPLVAVALDIAEAILIQQRAHRTRRRGHLIGVRGVSVPGEEIERQALDAAHVEELAIEVIADAGRRIAADLHVGHLLFNEGGGDAIEVEIAVEGIIPHLRAHVRLVPDFPVADIVVETIRPALVVVADDVDANLCPFGEILRREGMVLARGMLDAGAQPVDDGRARIENGLQVVIGGTEVVAGRVSRVGVEVGKDLRDIHLAGVRPVRIMQPAAGHAQLDETVGDIHQRTVAEWRVVHAMQRADGADVPCEIKGDF
ncbi:MAG: hypothetical protein BWY76_01563 [bacterium ADurb.Bin429]|nr:MAG: hypothetical protein BWY76_01563 [bacterium ADurb.Bin429]